MSKQDRIDSLKKELDEAYEQINQLRREANEGFTASSEYKRMQQEIKSLKLMQTMAEQHIETEVKHDKNLLQQVMKIREDNVALCKEHGINYWEGIAQVDRYAYRDIQDLEKKVVYLEAKVAAKDLIIEHLKDILGGRDPLAPKETVMGRKPIPEDQKKRIKAYRRQGYTLKEICAMEGVSLGAVSGICKGMIPKKEDPIPAPPTEITVTQTEHLDVTAQGEPEAPTPNETNSPIRMTVQEFLSQIDKGAMIAVFGCNSYEPDDSYVEPYYRGTANKLPKKYLSKRIVRREWKNWECRYVLYIHYIVS